VLTVGPIGEIGGSFFNQGSFSLAFDNVSGEVGIADSGQDVVHVFNTATNTYKTLAGLCVQQVNIQPGCVALHADGSGIKGTFADLAGVAFDPSTNAFYATDYSNFDIRKVTPNGNVTTIAGNGTPASVDGIGLLSEFTGPSCIALDPASDTLLVCDGYGGQLRIVTTHGRVPPRPSDALALVQTPSALSGPAAIARSSDGSLWFPETIAGFMGRLSADGKIREYPLPGGYANPYDAAADAQGDIWFGDYTGPNSFGQGAHAFIARIDRTGSVVETPFPNHCPYNVSSASSLSPDSLGGVWFGVSCPGAVGYETPQHRISQFLTPSPTGIILGSGYLWIGAYNELQKYALNGVLLATYTGLNADAGITASPDGHIWFLSSFYQTVGDFDPSTGTSTIITLPSCGCSRSIGNPTFGPDGALWFTEDFNINNQILPGGLGRLMATGSFSEYHSYEPRSSPSGIAVDSTGRIWFSDSGASKIGYVP
jgi:virginiamycin B lyase